MSELEANLSNVDGWLTDSIQSLKGRNKGGNQKSNKAKVDEIYKEKKEREIDMDNVRALAKQIMNEENICDEFALKDSLGDVESKWHELTEHLVQQVSLEVS